MKDIFFCRCQYQNKKALFTDPIFSEGFVYNILLYSCCPNTKSCCGIHAFVSITEPSCPSYKFLDVKNGTISRIGDLTRNSEYPGKDSNYEID